MSYPVSYYCPHCGAVVELEREGYLADKAVTPYPFEGWEYAAPNEAFEEAEGVAFTCGEDGTLVDNEETGCGERFYLSFVKFEEGEEVVPEPSSEFVEIGRERPRGPRYPGGPSG